MSSGLAVSSFCQFCCLLSKMIPSSVMVLLVPICVPSSFTELVIKFLLWNIMKSTQKKLSQNVLQYFLNINTLCTEINHLKYKIHWKCLPKNKSKMTSQLCSHLMSTHHYLVSTYFDVYVNSLKIIDLNCFHYLTAIWKL